MSNTTETEPSPHRAAPQVPVPTEPDVPDSADESPSVSDRFSDPDIRAYIRRNVIKAGVIVALVVVALGFTSIYFKQELLDFCSAVLDKVGLAGIAAILYVSDAFCAPIPSDFTLIVIANSDLSAYWPIVVPALALWSSFAGASAWFMGTKVGHTRWAAQWFGRLQSGKSHELVAKLGKWGVAVGALTPIPYSLTCWVAGTLELTLREIFWVNLLRLPRFLFLYVTFAHSDDIVRLFM